MCDAVYRGVWGQACCGAMMEQQVSCLLSSRWPMSRLLQAWQPSVSTWACKPQAERECQQSMDAAVACLTMQISPAAEKLTGPLGMCNGVPRPMSDHGQPRQNPAPTRLYQDCTTPNSRLKKTLTFEFDSNLVS